MFITKPSYTILHELDRQSLPVRIEYSGRICYKSEDKIDETSAIPFVRKMADYGHNSVLEMGVVTFRLSGLSSEQVTAFYRCQPKYLNIEIEADNTLFITGSIRGYREMFVNHKQNDVTLALTNFLGNRHPYFFETVCRPEQVDAPKNIVVEKIELEQIEQFEGDRLALHRYLGVRFIVNRAVTHELVRHRPCAFLQESQRYCRYSADKFGNEVTFIQPLFYQEDSTEFKLWKQAMEATEKIYLELLETSSPQAARTVLPNACKTEIIVYTNLAEWRHILALRTPKNADPSMREVMIPLQQELQGLYPALF